jgi:formylglycine-generating enzyme required for sulfatase activity
MWQPSFMNDPRLLELPHTVQPTGAAGECTNEYGAFDMVGNLHEWLADPHGVFAGGYFMDTFQNGEGCEYRTRAHRFDYHDYSTGFRCCVEAPPLAGGG